MNLTEHTERVQVGEFSKTVVEILKLDVEVGTPIFIGESNRRHMEQSHPKDFKKYGSRLARVISAPDYVGVRDDGTVEYIKAFGVHIKIAVRVSKGGDYYARSLYHIDDKAAKHLVAVGAWKSVTS